MQEMASKEDDLLSRAWREQWNVEHWMSEVNQHMTTLDDGLCKQFMFQLTGNMLQYALSSPALDGIYISYLKSGLATEQIRSVDVFEYICKNNNYLNMKQLPIALRILECSISCIRKPRHENDSFNLAICLVKALCWLFGAIAFLLRNALKCARNVIKAVDVQSFFGLSDKCFELTRLLMDNTSMFTLLLIGKLELRAEQEEMIQTRLNELVQLSTDSRIDDSLLQQQCDSNLKALMNVATRFFNSTIHGVMSQSRKPGHVPSHSLQTLVEIQVIENFYMESSLMMDLFDAVLRFENIPIDQFYVDLLRCGCHGILNASNTQEELLWSSFFLFKIPLIVSCLRTKYRKTGLDNTVFITSCIQFAKMNVLLDNLDIHCRFQCLPSFLAQCQKKGLLDKNNIEKILSHRRNTADLLDVSVMPDRSPLGNILNAGRLLSDVIKVLSLPLEEGKDIIKQQLTQLSNSVEFGRQLAAAAGLDLLSDFLDLLLRVNENTKGPITEPNEDRASLLVDLRGFASLSVTTGDSLRLDLLLNCHNKSNFAEIRADIFNCSFLLLSYTTAVFGIKVLALVSNRDAFFVNWRLNCSQDIGQKRYSPMALEMILDQVMTNNTSNINAVLAKWDDYCLCSGAVINELAQALACSVIIVDKIQRVCETFKNKRPALSICASAWLCTQYATMNANKRDMIIKILRAFRGQKSQQKTARSEYIARIIEDVTGTVDLEPTMLMKGKPGGKPDSTQRNAPIISSMPEILTIMSRFPGSPRVDKRSLSELKRNMEVLSPHGFCKVLVKSILEAGKIDEANSFETLASTLMMLDPIILFQSLCVDSLPSILRRCDAFKLLSDPQGKTLAKFISKAITYALITSKHEKLDGFQRRSNMAHFEVYRGHGNASQIRENLVSLIEDLLLTLKWQQSGSIALFLRSLLEQLSITTMHLTPSFKLPQQLGVKLSKALPDVISNDIFVLICNLEDVRERKELSHRLCNSFICDS